jgi:hypothetical protein
MCALVLVATLVIAAVMPNGLRTLAGLVGGLFSQFRPFSDDRR